MPALCAFGSHLALCRAQSGFAAAGRSNGLRGSNNQRPSGSRLVSVCSLKTPFDAALAAFETRLPREQFEGTVLVCDGTYLATALCRAAGVRGAATADVQSQFLDVIDRLRVLTRARGVVAVFDSGVRKPPVPGSPEARRTRAANEAGEPLWWAQRGRPGSLARAATSAGYRAVVADPWLEADDLAMSVALRLHERGQSALLVSGDTDFQHGLRPGLSHAAAAASTTATAASAAAVASAEGPGAAAAAAAGPGEPGAVSWLRVSQFACKMHPVAEVVTWQSFCDSYGFPPALYGDYLALVGRPRGGVAGVSGIGDRAARSLIRRFGRLEYIFAAAAAGKTRAAWRPEVAAALTRPGEIERAVRDRDALLPVWDAAPPLDDDDSIVVMSAIPTDGRGSAAAFNPPAAAAAAAPPSSVAAAAAFESSVPPP